MIFKSILAPVDGSAPSNAAVTLAVTLAKEGAASLAFCHVVQLPLPVHDAGGFAREEIMEEDTARAREILEAARKRAADAGITAKTEVLVGPVVDAILEAAKEYKTDVIVMGTHGRTGIVRAVLGSKTADVIARSPIPVLVAPHPPGS
ncbi:MAG: universal stress protein [Candidatus Eremiobacteraeota bacterium]|nr:universal stress protein [Candidatus Eremiobacteraeota bacterium]